ncbi:hypothetical protein Y1Q_0010997 [Alligator mississippiensis]|uniref:Uncharacterized protein n=1 Tax=Alligator mississippiensis TaxID=8496 RepID=A0A151P6P9_ALLMI|nr:hypothetical protein Y1Q_0010997 [Alligator mississippiensis]
MCLAVPPGGSPGLHRGFHLHSKLFLRDSARAASGRGSAAVGAAPAGFSELGLAVSAFNCLSNEQKTPAAPLRRFCPA